MGYLTASEKSGLGAGLVLTVMAAFLAGLASESFVSGFAVTAAICAIALLAATVAARAVNSRRRR